MAPVRALLIASLAAALAAPARRRTRHHSPVARRHAPVGHRVGPRSDCKRVIALRVRRRRIDRAVGASRRDPHPGHRCDHPRVRQTVCIALHPDPVAELRRQREAKVERVADLSRAGRHLNYSVSRCQNRVRVPNICIRRSTLCRIRRRQTRIAERGHLRL